MTFSKKKRKERVCFLLLIRYSATSRESRNDDAMRSTRFPSEFATAFIIRRRLSNLMEKEKKKRKKRKRYQISIVNTKEEEEEEAAWRRNKKKRTRNGNGMAYKQVSLIQQIQCTCLRQLEIGTLSLSDSSSRSFRTLFFNFFPSSSRITISSNS